MGRFIENPPTFPIRGCQDSVILVEKRVEHLTRDTFTLYTRIRQSNVSLSGGAAGLSDCHIVKDAVSKERLVRPG
jgi:hypothetical protein